MIENTEYIHAGITSFTYPIRLSNIFIYFFILCKKHSYNNNVNKELFLVEDIESDVTYAIQNEALPLTSPVESPVAKEPIKFSEIRSRSSNQ